jgi:hypothetical protein
MVATPKLCRLICGIRNTCPSQRSCHAFSLATRLKSSACVYVGMALLVPSTEYLVSTLIAILQVIVFVQTSTYL